MVQVFDYIQRKKDKKKKKKKINNYNKNKNPFREKREKIYEAKLYSISTRIIVYSTTVIYERSKNAAVIIPRYTMQRQNGL